MPRDKALPFHKSILNHIANANAAEMQTYAHLIMDTLIPPSSTQEILRAWKRRCHEIGCPDHGITKHFSS